MGDSWKSPVCGLPRARGAYHTTANLDFFPGLVELYSGIYEGGAEAEKRMEGHGKFRPRGDGTKAGTHRQPFATLWRSAGIAQLVEQRIRNAQVGGSTPLTGTTFLLVCFGPLFVIIGEGGRAKFNRICWL